MQTLKECRESKGVKQNAVSSALKITRQTYAKYENSPEIMPMCFAQAACDYLGVDMSQIFFGARGK